MLRTIDQNFICKRYCYSFSQLQMTCERRLANICVAVCWVSDRSLHRRCGSPLSVQVGDTRDEGVTNASRRLIWSRHQLKTALSLYFHSLPVLFMASNTNATQRAIICALKRSGLPNDDTWAALVVCHDISDQRIKHIFAYYREK